VRTSLLHICTLTAVLGLGGCEPERGTPAGTGGSPGASGGSPATGGTGLVATGGMPGSGGTSPSGGMTTGTGGSTGGTATGGTATGGTSTGGTATGGGPTAPELITSGPNAYWNTAGQVTKVTSGTADLTVDENTKYQLWDGFGGTFNEMGWDALSVVSSEITNALRLLFAADGANFVFGRIPIGASD
jgi:glucosylceramidase